MARSAELIRTASASERSWLVFVWGRSLALAVLAGGRSLTLTVLLGFAQTATHPLAGTGVRRHWPAGQ